MKNLVFTLVCSLLVVSLYAQDAPLTGKKGQPILPEAGDIGVGFNAIPFLNWFGNSFNNNSNNRYADDNRFLNMFGNTVVMGRYMLTEKTALRVHFGADVFSRAESRLVQSDASNDPEEFVTDTRNRSNANINIGAGYEMRRGKGRIQGYYGADVALGFDFDNTVQYGYGNGFGSTNVVPTSFDWGSNINGNERVLDVTGATTISVMVRPFIGVEYFVDPKLSVGAEFGYGIRYAGTTEASETVESYEASSNTTLIDVNTIPASNGFNLGTDNFNGAVFLFFYF